MITRLGVQCFRLIQMNVTAHGTEIVFAHLRDPRTVMAAFLRPPP